MISSSQQPLVITQAVKLVASAGTPVALGSGLVESIAIRPGKARGTANSGDVYLGFGSTNDTQQLWKLATGDTPFCIHRVEGKKIDLGQIWIDAATDGDGVIFFAIN